MWPWIAIATCVVGWAWTCVCFRNVSRNLKDVLRSSAASDAADRYRLAEEAAGFGVWEIQAGADSALLSAGAALLCGFPAAETRVEVAKLIQMVHPEDQDSLGLKQPRGVENLAGREIEFRVRFGDGSYRWRRSRIRGEGGDGTPVRLVGTLLDITQEKEMLEQLTESAERLRIAEQAADFGLSVWDPVSGLLSL